MTREQALHELGLDVDATTHERRAAFFALLQKKNALSDLAAFGRLYAAHQRLERDGPQADAKPQPPKPGWAQWFDQHRMGFSWKVWLPLLLVGFFLSTRGRRTEQAPAQTHVASTPATPQEAQRAIDGILETARQRHMPAFETELVALRAALGGTSCGDAQKKLDVAIATFADAPPDVKNSQGLAMERVRGGVEALCRDLAKPKPSSVPM